MLPLLPLVLLAGFVTDTVAYGPDPKQAVDVIGPDIVASADQPLRPVVVFLHGGVWQSSLEEKPALGFVAEAKRLRGGWGNIPTNHGGDRRQHRHVGNAFAAQGFVAVVASYRLAPVHRWPAAIEDAASIVALVKDKATSWGGDPARIVLVGHSAGGQLASLLVLDDRWLKAKRVDARSIAAVVAISGVFDLRAPLDDAQADGGFARFVAPVFGADVATLRAASPIQQLQPFAVPVLLATASNDELAMRAQTEAMARAMRLRGDVAQIVDVNDRDHDSMVAHIGDADDELTREIARFLRRTLTASSPSSSPSSSSSSANRP